MGIIKDYTSPSLCGTQLAANLTLTCKAKLFSVRCKEGKDIRQAIRWRVIEAMDRHKATGDNM